MSWRSWSAEQFKWEKIMLRLVLLKHFIVQKNWNCKIISLCDDAVGVVCWDSIQSDLLRVCELSFNLLGAQFIDRDWEQLRVASLYVISSSQRASIEDDEPKNKNKYNLLSFIVCDLLEPSNDDDDDENADFHNEWLITWKCVDRSNAFLILQIISWEPMHLGWLFCLIWSRSNLLEKNFLRANCWFLSWAKLLREWKLW